MQTGYAPSIFLIVSGVIKGISTGCIKNASTSGVIAFTDNIEVGNPGHIHPNSEWFYNDVKQYDFNPDKANQLLDELGMKDTNVDGVCKKGFWAVTCRRGVKTCTR